MNKFLFLLLAVSSLHQSVSAVDISEVKFGLVCTDNKTYGWICHETKNIYITGQGKCIYDNENNACTWYGFSFHYTNAEDGDALNCKGRTSIPVNDAGPNGLIDQKTKETSFEIPLNSGEGDFFNPQYSVFAVAKSRENIIKQTTTCF